MRDIVDKFAPVVPAITFPCFPPDEEIEDNYAHSVDCPACETRFGKVLMPRKKKDGRRKRPSGQKRNQADQDGSAKKRASSASGGVGGSKGMSGAVRSDKKVMPKSGAEKSKMKGEKTTATDLLQDVVVKIFAYLSKRDLKNVALVCKAWSECALDSRLWKSISLDGRRLPSVTVAVALLQGMPQLKKLELLQWSGNDTKKIICTVWRTAPNLECLYLQDIYCLEDVLIRLPQKFMKLKEISLVHMKEDGQHFLDRLVPLADLQRMILGQSYTFHGCTGQATYFPPLLPDASMEWKWRSLEEVCIFRKPSDVEFRLVICNISSQLRKLAVGLLEQTGSFALLSHCTSLNELHLVNAKKMDDQGLLSGVGSLLELKHLTMRCLTSTTIFGLNQFWSRRQVVGNLESLDMSYSHCVTDNVLSLVVRSCPRLKHVSLGGCHKISGAGLKCLVAGCPELLRVDLYKCQLDDPYLLTELRPDLQVNLI